MDELVLHYGPYYIFFTLILFYLFRKHLISVFDPFVFTILMMSSSLSMSVDTNFFGYIFFSILFFIIGFKIVGLPKRNCFAIDNIVDIKLLEIFTVLFFLLYFVITILMLKDSGIPLFSDNPTESKTSMFVEGTGWIRRITFLSPFLTICICLSLILSKKKKFFFIIFIVYVFLSLLGGSKSGLIGIIAIFWYLYQQDNLWSVSILYIKNLIKSKVKYFFIVTLLLFVFIAIKESAIEGVDPFFSIGFRLMEFGDVMLYYGHQEVRDFFVHLNFIDFILYEFNGIFGMLRLAPYYEPLGYQMVKAYWNTNSLFDDVVLGPNTVFFVKGHIFFGYIGGIVYSFFIGAFAAYARKRIIEMKIKNIFTFALAVYFFFQIPNFLREFSQGVSSLFDFVFYLGPIILVSLILKESLKKVGGIDNMEKQIR
jgi:oligosaccharide repeat unit polymerase